MPYGSLSISLSESIALNKMLNKSDYFSVPILYILHAKRTRIRPASDRIRRHCTYTIVFQLRMLIRIQQHYENEPFFDASRPTAQST